MCIYELSLPLQVAIVPTDTVALARIVTYLVTSASFLAELSVSSPQKLFIFISRKIFSGSKYPKNILFNFEKGSTAGDRLWVLSICVGYCYIMSDTQELTVLVQQLVKSHHMSSYVTHSAEISYQLITADTDAVNVSDPEHVDVPVDISTAQIREVSNQVNPSIIRGRSK